MAATSVTTMSRMVDMALGSPEIGAVNFNVLHSLLHAMLQQLNLGDARAEMNADDRDFLTRRSALPPDRAQGGRDTDSGIDDLTPIPQNKSRYHQLEDKVDRIEKQMMELGALPTNAELFERVKTDHSATPPEQKSSKHHVSDMWQQMQLVKLVDTNKEGVEKSMSLIDDIMTQLQHVGELQEQLQKSQENMKKNLNMSDLWNKLKELENASSSLKDRIEMLPDAEVLENFATWSGLEDGLKGVRQEIPQPKPLHTSSSQTSPAVKETSGSSPAPTPIPEADKMDARQRSASRASRMSSPGPSQELQNLLEQLGKLTDKHSMVVQRLERLENMLKDGVGSGHDEKQLKAIQEEVDVLKKYREQMTHRPHEGDERRDHEGKGERKSDGKSDNRPESKTESKQQDVKTEKIQQDYRTETRSADDRTERRPQDYRTETRSPDDISERRPQDYRTETRSPDDRNERRPQDYRTETRSPDDRSERRPQDYRTETRSPDDRTENKQQDYRTESRQPDSRTESRQQDYRTESGQPEGRTETRQQDYRTESRQPDGRTDTRQQDYRTESRHPDDRTESRQSSYRTESGQPDGRSESRHADYRTDSRHADSRAEGRRTSRSDSRTEDRFARGRHDERDARTPSYADHSTETVPRYAHPPMERVPSETGLGEVMDVLNHRRTLEVAPPLVQGSDDSRPLSAVQGSILRQLQSELESLDVRLEELSQNVTRDRDAFADQLVQIDEQLAAIRDSVLGNGLPGTSSTPISLSTSGSVTDMEGITNVIPDAVPGAAGAAGAVVVAAGAPAVETMESSATVQQTATETTHTSKNERVAALEKQLRKSGGEMKQLQQRFRLLNRETNRQLTESKLFFSKLDDELRNINHQLLGLMKGTTKVQDSDALHQMQQAALQMQSEVEKLGVSTQQLIDDNNSKQSHIDTLYTLSNKLDDNKADKEYIQMELGEKADRRLVDSKVNKVMFDSALDELNQLVNDILEKLTGHEKSCLTSLDELTKRPKAVTEEEWKKAMEQLSGDVDSKLDRLEFGPIRDELERQLRQLSRRLKRMDVGASGEDDAAGIRKQLLQRFHCISCDRQVDMYPHSPFPSIPQQGQMPVSKSARPYTTYELEQIRQHSRNMPQPAVDVVDVYSTMRQCGGTHTMTYPHRRITRVTTYNQAIKDDEATPLPNQKPEVDIQGADGHIYRGRFVAGFQDLSLAQNPSQPLPPRMRRSQTSKGSRMSSLTHRPSSARQGENDSHRTFTQSVPPSNNIHDSYTNATGSFSRPQSTTDVANRNGLDSGANRGGQTKSLPRSKSAASSKVRSSSEMHPKRTTSQPQSVVMAEKAKRVESPTQVPAVEVPSRPNSAANSMHEINEAWQRSQEDITSRIASQEVIDMPELVDELSPAGQASFEDFSDQNNTD